jgi:hypothetical protein
LRPANISPLDVARALRFRSRLDADVGFMELDAANLHAMSQQAMKMANSLSGTFRWFTQSLHLQEPAEGENGAEDSEYTSLTLQEECNIKFIQRSNFVAHGLSVN